MSKLHYNLTAAGPLLAHRASVLPEDFPRASGRFVDVSSARGREVRLSENLIRKILSIDREDVRALVKAGALRRARGAITRMPSSSPSPVRMIWFDPADTRRTLYDRWVAQLVEPTSLREFDMYKRVRRACGITRVEDDPEVIYSAMARELLRLNRFSNRDEVRNPSYYEMYAFTNDCNRRVKQLHAGLARHGARRPISSRVPTTGAPSRDAILKQFPILHDLPRTFLSATHHREAPSAALLDAAWGTARLRAAAIAFVSWAAPKQRREKTLKPRVVLFSKFAAEIQPTGSEGEIAAADIETTLEALAFGADAGAKYSEQVRAELCLNYFVVRDVIASMVDAVNVDGLRPQLAALVPHDHSDRDDFVRRLFRVYGHLPTVGQQRRKLDSDPLADSINEAEDITEVRMQQMFAAVEELRLHGRKHLGAKTPDELPKTRGHRPTVAERFRGFYREAIVRMPVLTFEGKLLKGEQETRWRIWRVDDFVMSMQGGGDPIAKRRAKDQARNRLRQTAGVPPEPTARALEDDLIYEYVGCAPVDGAAAVEPWFVQIWRSGVLCAVDLMTWRMRAARNHAIRKWKTPTLSGSGADLLKFDETKVGYWRTARMRNRLIVPITEFGHAMLFARAGSSAVRDNWSRMHEFLQQRYEKPAWPKRRIGSVVQPTFLAIPKVAPGAPIPPPVRFAVQTRTMITSFSAAKLTIERCGYPDGKLPSIPFYEEYRWKIPEDGPWIFQFNCKMLRLPDMQLFLDFLYAGIGRYDYHDLRHAGANRGRRERLPLSARMQQLNQVKPGSTRLYDRETVREGLRLITQRVVTLAKLSAQRLFERRSRSE